MMSVNTDAEPGGVTSIQDRPSSLIQIRPTASDGGGVVGSKTPRPSQPIAVILVPSDTAPTIVPSAGSPSVEA